MGIASYFRWLSGKYPKIISNVVEEQPDEVDGAIIPIDITKANPNGEETDNLYLDMNNIVHPCTHPEGQPAPETEEEMFLEVFKYAERIVNMVRPRKVLMMAVDGVAPRAKMNQQRSRRFRAAQDAREEEENKLEFHKTLIDLGKAEPGSKPNADKKWDSNVITPGTPFMNKLALALRYWTAYKLNTDPGWKDIKVIISDASIPGEGEHKIMEFIRMQRRSPHHDPNTRHVIYGLDADLIMLGLATHEPHFRILREDVFFQQGKAAKCHLCGQTGHMAAACKGEAKEKVGEFDEMEKAVKKPFIWLHVHVLREYLEIEMQLPNHPIKWDLERAIDDYVFLCFFVGNDFLPHLPSLEIREEGIDTLLRIWKEKLGIMGDYVTKDGTVSLQKAEIILEALGSREAQIFQRRRDQEVKREQRRQQRENGGNNRGAGDNRWNGAQNGSNSKKRKTAEDPNDLILFAPGQANSRQVRETVSQIYLDRKEIFQAQVENANNANKSAAAIIKEQLLKKKQSLEESATPSEKAEVDTNQEIPEEITPSALGKRKADLVEEASTDNATPGRTTPVQHAGGQTNPSEMPEDDVRLWEEGYEDRYYEKKFRVDPKDKEFRYKVASAYVEGLSWVLLYYMQGCPSWQWFYPFHYAPFAADFKGMGQMKPNFTTGEPFKPYEQLMGVFPADSRHAIPKPYRVLMTDPDSPIIDFYPEDFEIDLNGKKFKWQGTALLPFIDEKRLLGAMATKVHLLSDDEVYRNERGRDVLFFSQSHDMHEDVLMKLYSKKQESNDMDLNAKKSHGLTGKVERIDSYLPNSPLKFPLAGNGMPDLPVDNSMSVYFDIPPSKHVHKSQLLRGLVQPAKRLDDNDVEQTRRGSRGRGRGYGGVPFDRRGNYNDRRNSGRGGGGGNGQQNINYGNPFAQHVDFNNAPYGQGRGFPQPPPLVNGQPVPPPGWNAVAGQGGLAPPPPHFGNQGQGQNWRGGGYNNNNYQGGYNNNNNNNHQGYNDNRGYNNNHNQQQGYNDNRGYGGQQNSYNNNNNHRGGYDNRRDGQGGRGGSYRGGGGPGGNPYGRR